MPKSSSSLLSKFSLSKDSVTPRHKVLGAHPAFYLIYLSFYFIPWLIEAPKPIDVAVLVGALIIFIPLHFSSFNSAGKSNLWRILLMEAIALALAPFHGNHGVFHIYATAAAAFLRPLRFVYILMIGLALIYSLSSLLSQDHYFQTLINMFIGFVIGIGSLATSESLAHQKQLERSRDLDTELATVRERDRIASDLHDVLGHTLTTISLKAQVAEKFLEKDRLRSRQEIEDIQVAARTALKNVRDTLAGLHDTNIELELERARRAMNSTAITLTVIGVPPALKPKHQRSIGLVVREALTNILRHSNGDLASVKFDQAGDHSKIAISSNGPAHAIIEGSGITGMKKRLEDIDGSLTINTENGVEVTIDIPSSALFLKGKS